MRIKAKMIMLALATGSMMLHLAIGGGSCGRFWGDVAGDLLILQGVD